MAKIWFCFGKKMTTVLNKVSLNILDVVVCFVNFVRSRSMFASVRLEGLGSRVLLSFVDNFVFVF